MHRAPTATSLVTRSFECHTMSVQFTHRAIHRSCTGEGANWLPTREINRGPGDPHDSGHRRRLSTRRKSRCGTPGPQGAYDTVWHRGLHFILLQTIPDWHIVSFIMEMITNRRFTLHNSGGQRSRLRRLKPLKARFFNIYIYDIRPHQPRSTDTQTTWHPLVW